MAVKDTIWDSQALKRLKAKGLRFGIAFTSVWYPDAHSRAAEPRKRIAAEIKKAVAGGHKLRQIWECLDEDGIHLSYSKFWYYVARLKRTDVSGQGVPTLDVKEASRAVADPESPEYDPAKNLRERLTIACLLACHAVVGMREGQPPD